MRASDARVLGEPSPTEHRLWLAPVAKKPGDRREATRLPIEIDVDVEGAAHRFRTTTRDLSRGGMFVVTHREIPVGTHVMLAFKLPNGTELEVLGVVKWRDETEGRGLGLAFFCLEPEAKRVLAAFCDVRVPLYAESGEFPATDAAWRSSADEG